MRAALNRETELHARLDQVSGQRKRAENDVIGANREVAGARSTERQAQLGVTDANLGNLRQREATAASQAERLGALGPIGRMQGVMALQMARQFGGVDHLPPELQEQLGAVAPEELKKFRREAGERYAPEMQAMGLTEYRDRLPEIRKKVDQAESQKTAGKEEDIQQYASDIGRAIESPLRELTELIMREIAAVEGRIEAMFIHRHVNESMH